MKRITIISAVIWLLTSCSSNISITADNTGVTATEPAGKEKNGNNLITFKINGTPANTISCTISLFAWGNQAGKEWLNLNYNIQDAKLNINVSLNSPAPQLITIPKSGDMQHYFGYKIGTVYATILFFQF